MNIIGLGKAACAITRRFDKFPQYTCICIDSEKPSDITIRKKKTHDEYDASFPNVMRRLKLTPNEPVLVIIGGSGAISGGCLQLLQQLSGEEVQVLYIRPDVSLLGEVQKQQEKIVRSVLQEYARSGLLSMVYLIDNSALEESIGDVPILGHFDVLNEAVVNTMHMINVFKNTEPILGNFIQPSPLARIASIGVVDVEKEKESWFFDLQSPRDVVYYYGISEEDLKTDGTLFKKITDYVKSQADENINVSYGVFQTQYENKYCYCIKYSSVVQSYLDGREIG